MSLRATTKGYGVHAAASRDEHGRSRPISRTTTTTTTNRHLMTKEQCRKIDPVDPPQQGDNVERETLVDKNLQFPFLALLVSGARERNPVNMHYHLVVVLDGRIISASKCNYVRCDHMTVIMSAPLPPVISLWVAPLTLLVGHLATLSILSSGNGGGS
ncbi:hypothetical protein Sjap_002847 [Stephania japonica]|uniref:Uncharacterized protein n=1 Tax=Stephania japonica TaxID=461633 RepID=A0AAP0KML5_9MAGN